MGSKNKKKQNKKRKSKKANQNNPVHDIVSDGHEHSETELASENDNQYETDLKPQKRQHSDEDSEPENEPRKKKKKKKPSVQENATDKKNKKSIRQMKKEKHAQRQAEMEAASKEQLKSQCLNYLSQWKHNKSNWKFMKAKQVWLYKNKFSLSLVPNESWPLLMEYFESAQGNIRNMLLDDANKIIKQMDDWTESQTGVEPEEHDSDEGDESKDTTKPTKPDDAIYKRARDLIQCLQEYNSGFISI